MKLCLKIKSKIKGLVLREPFYFRLIIYHLQLEAGGILCANLKTLSGSNFALTF